VKNQYVGDINDYVKFAFLRRVIGGGIDLTVCWMLTSDDEGKDGSRRGYLDQPERFRRHDPDLFDTLAGDLRHARDIKGIEEGGVLPNARFLSDLLEDDDRLRAIYFRRVVAALPPKSLIFFDPDNGLDVATVRAGKRNSSKYLYRKELRAILDLGHSAIVYQHFPHVARERFVSDVFKSLESRQELLCACIYTSHVAYLLLLQDPHGSVLEAARGFARDWEPTVRFARAVSASQQENG
jgi:hypothetical protein